MFNKLQLNITYDCDLTCPYCTQREYPAYKKGSPKQQFLNNLAKVMNYERLFIPWYDVTIMGGEPFLDIEYLFKILKYINTKGTVSFMTNGNFLTEELVLILSSMYSNIDFIISFDSTYKVVTDHKLKIINFIKSKNLSLHTVFVVTKFENLEEDIAAIKQLNNAGINPRILIDRFQFDKFKNEEICSKFKDLFSQVKTKFGFMPGNLPTDCKVLVVDYSGAYNCCDLCGKLASEYLKEINFLDNCKNCEFNKGCFCGISRIANKENACLARKVLKETYGR